MLEHVIVVTDSASVDGGSAKVALSSAIALAGSGLSITVFAAAGQPDPILADCPNLTVVNTNQGDALASQNRVGGALRGLWNVAAGREMKRLLGGLDPSRSVVHVHGWTKALSSSVVGIAVRARFPVVVTLHEYFSACPNGCFYIHPKKEICTLSPMSMDCITTNCDSRSYAFKMYRVARQAVQLTAGELPRGISHYIAVSAFSQRILQPLLPPKSHFYSVDNPIDAVPNSRTLAEKNDRFIFVGRLSPEKGGALLAEAARRAGVPITFVGDGAERETIERINPSARVTGWLSREEVQKHMATARVLVVPSLWYETLGLAVMEAGALGIPAIVPSGTAPHDLIEPDRTGLSFLRGNIEQLTSVMQACSTDDALVQRLSESVHAEYWERPLTMGRHMGQLRAAYDSVLADYNVQQDRSATESTEICA